MIAKMLARNEYGQMTTKDQVCSRCGRPVAWRLVNSVWSPLNPETRKPHTCKENNDGNIDN